MRFYTLDAGLIGTRILTRDGEAMADDGVTNADAAAGDNVWTIDNIRRDLTNTPTPLAIRFMVSAGPYLTTGDVAPFHIVDTQP